MRKRLPRTPKSCAHCAREFVPDHGNAVACSDECRMERRAARRRKRRRIWRRRHTGIRCFGCLQRFKPEGLERYCSESCREGGLKRCDWDDCAERIRIVRGKPTRYCSEAHMEAARRSAQARSEAARIRRPRRRPSRARPDKHLKALARGVLKVHRARMKHTKRSRFCSVQCELKDARTRVRRAQRYRDRYRTDTAFRRSENRRSRGLPSERRRERKKASRKAFRTAVFLQSAGRCEYCGVKLGPDWHVDHVMPLVRGGASTLANCVASCVRCNMKKSARPAYVRQGALLA